jgi:zinc protease
MSLAERLTAAAVLCCTLLLTGPAVAGPKIQSWHTTNGARVLFVQAPQLPMLDVRVVFNAGSAREAVPGVASMTNSMLTQGAGSWNVDQIADRLESVGSDLEVGSLRDMAWVSLRTLIQQPALGASLTTLTTLLADPTFPAPDLERLRKNALVSLSQDEQEPRTVGSKALYRALYGSHPYAHDPAGTKQDVTAITRTQLTDFFRRWYVAKNAVVAMVGAVDRAQAEHIAEQVTSGLAPGAAAPPLPAVVDLGSGRLQRIAFPSSQSHVYVGQPGIRRDDPDFFALTVGNHVLGGSGLVSLLSEEVREKRGLSYSVYSYFLPMQQRGPFIMGLQTKNSQTDKALDVLMQTLRRFLAQGPTDKELSDAKKNITGGFPLQIASNSKIVEYLSMIGFYDLPLDFLDTYNAKVEAVTAQEVRDAFRRHLDPAHFVTVVVGPAKGAAPSGKG